MKLGSVRKKLLILLAAAAAAILIIFAVMGSTLDICVGEFATEQEAENAEIVVTLEDPSIAAVTDTPRSGVRRYIRLKRTGSGETMGYIYVNGEDTVEPIDLKTVFPGVLMETYKGNFNGSNAVTAVVMLFFLLSAYVLFEPYRKRKKESIYSYKTLLSFGCGFYAISLGFIFFMLLLFSLRDGTDGYTLLMDLINGSFSFMLLTAPLLLAFLISMIHSNISLMRHERPRVTNALGILIGIGMLAGFVIAICWKSMDFEGSVAEYRISIMLIGIYCATYVFFEALLMSSIFCGLVAARQEPERNADYIVILGCMIRKDGTLFPLIRGRVDRALAFYRDQIEKTGKVPILMPSGGQGPNEVTSEAAAMKRYLLEQGVPEEHIVIEDQSRNTYQNMAFSKAIIEAAKPDAVTVFSTTNYHVYRSSMWAKRAGLKATGMGSKTVWYFWPNAFMREVVGLVQAEWKQILIVLAIRIALYAWLVMSVPMY